MARSFDWRAQLKDRRTVVRVVLGALLAANLATIVVVFRPLGGSAEDLVEEMQSKQRDLTQLLHRVERTKSLEAKVQQAKVEGDRFLDQYTMNRRSAFSTLIGEADKLAVQSGMKPKESSWVMDPVEGSDTIQQLTITANYEGSYQSLTKFLNMLDRSPRFLIVDSLQAQPQSSGALSVTIRLDTFIREVARAKS
jgi:Tfp pilus assembly protein PilO